MTRKKILPVLLALMLMLSCFAGCGGGGPSASAALSAAAPESAVEEPAAPPEAVVEEAVTEETPAEPASAEEAIVEEAPIELVLEEVALPLFAETKTFSLWMPLPFFMSSYVTDMSTDVYVLAQVQEQCNVKFDVTAISDMTENEKFNLMVAAGDYTDIFTGASNYSGGYDSAISNDVCIDLYDLVQEYAPNYWAYVNSSDDLRAALVTDGGAIASIATIYKEAGMENGGLLYRPDYLADLVMDVPQTYDDLHDYIQACNSTFGTQGLAIGGTTMMSVGGEVTQLSYGYDFGIGSNSFNVVDGEVVYSYLNENCYDYLSMMAKWYADGTIAPEFYNFDTDDGDVGFANDVYCMTINGAKNILTINTYAEDGEEVPIAGMASPKRNAGDELHYSWTDDFSRIKRVDTWSVSVDCKEPEAVMEIVNFMFSEAGQLLYNYGTEGYTFNYVDGKPMYSDVVINNETYNEMLATYLFVSNVTTGYIPGIMDVGAGYYYFTDAQWELVATFQTCDADGSYNMPTAVSLSEDENTQYAAIASDVQTYVSSAILEFITVPGALTEDSFAAFQQSIQDMGAETMEEIYQAAYERYLKKLPG